MSYILKAYEGDEPYIFISYSHHDMERVYPVLEKLSAANIRFWYDGGIEHSENYVAVIAKHVKNCAIFMPFHSEKSFESEFCKAEINFAFKYFKRTFSAFLQRVTLPDEVDFMIGSAQSTNFFNSNDEDAFVEKLLKSSYIQQCKNNSDVEIPAKNNDIASNKIKIKARKKTKTSLKSNQLSVSVKPNITVENEPIIKSKQSTQDYFNETAGNAESFNMYLYTLFFNKIDKFNTMPKLVLYLKYNEMNDISISDMNIEYALEENPNGNYDLAKTVVLTCKNSSETIRNLRHIEVSDEGSLVNNKSYFQVNDGEKLGFANMTEDFKDLYIFSSVLIDPIKPDEEFKITYYMYFNNAFHYNNAREDFIFVPKSYGYLNGTFNFSLKSPFDINAQYQMNFYSTKGVGDTGSFELVQQLGTSNAILPQVYDELSNKNNDTFFMILDKII